MISVIHSSHWPSIVALQAKVYHQIEPEPLAVLQAKWRYSPEYCFVYAQQHGIAAYLLAHEWPYDCLPKLGEMLPAPSDSAMPSNKTLFLHDLAISPDAKGLGIGRIMVQHLLNICKTKRIKCIKLVAIQGSVPFWLKMGFDIELGTNSPVKLASYGEDATVMERMC